MTGELYGDTMTLGHCVPPLRSTHAPDQAFGRATAWVHAVAHPQSGSRRPQRARPCTGDAGRIEASELARMAVSSPLTEG